MKRSLIVPIAAALLITGGCGGDDDDDASGDPAGESTTADDADTAADADSAATPAGAGSATFTLEGETYRFEQIEPGPDDDFYVFCTVIGDSLQAVMRQVDDAGNPVDGELSVILLEPGGAYEQTGDPPEVSVEINNERFLNYFEGDPIAAPASGRSGEGTVTLRETGAFDPATGEIETEQVEATLEVSC
jgi:hypothetical protein